MKAIRPNLKFIKTIKEFNVEGLITAFNGRLKNINNLTFAYILDNLAPDLKKLKEEYSLSLDDMRYCLAIEKVKPYPKYCSVCGKQIHVNPHHNKKGYANTCSRSCANKDPNRLLKLSKIRSDPEFIKKVQQKTCITNLAKYGVQYTFQADIVKDKIAQTNLDRYGVKNPFSSKEIQQKIKETNIKKYGTVHPMQCTEIKEKVKNTLLENYKVDCFFKRNDLIAEKLKTKYGVDNIMKLSSIKKNQQTNAILSLGGNLKETINISQLPDIKNKKLASYCDTIYKRIIEKCALQNNIVVPHFTYKEYLQNRDKIKDRNLALFDWQCMECGSIFKAPYLGFIPICRNCHPITYRTEQHEIANYIRSIYNKQILEDTRNIIPPLELDIYIPELKLAIEFNGNYWHSSELKDKYYHIEKTKICESNGIKLIHIFEYQWLYKKELIKHRLQHLLTKDINRIYARKCVVAEISYKLASEFLNAYHLQGTCNSKINLGLFDMKTYELVAVMTFGKPRFNRKYEYELLRFATKYQVIGGASKLLKYFETNYEPKNLISYANRCWTSINNNVYNKIGFSYIGESEPNYVYIRDKEVLARYQCQKHKLKSLLGSDNFDASKSETENMLNNDYLKIYDCGNLIFEKLYT